MTDQEIIAMFNRLHVTWSQGSRTAVVWAPGGFTALESHHDIDTLPALLTWLGDRGYIVVSDVLTLGASSVAAIERVMPTQQEQNAALIRSAKEKLTVAEYGALRKYILREGE